MDKLFLVSFLGILITAHGVAGNMVYDDIGMLEVIESLEIEEENGMELSPIPAWTSERGSKVLVNVDSVGAVGDGVSDDTQVNEPNFFSKPIFKSQAFTKNMNLLAYFNISNYYYYY